MGDISVIPLVDEGLGNSAYLLDLDDGRARVLDIRQDSEYDAGHVPGADHLELGALTARVEDLPNEPLVVMCGHGERAMGAASLLARAGHHDVTVLDGGPQDWVDKSGNALAVGR